MILISNLVQALYNLRPTYHKKFPAVPSAAVGFAADFHKETATPFVTISPVCCAGAQP